jgi:hypothetical protein
LGKLLKGSEIFGKRGVAAPYGKKGAMCEKRAKRRRNRE